MKKIVLLSDGTGNSAGKRYKTNVWRLYNALDLHRDDQIAMYDDGVGTRQFLLFKLLGGVFGWGLKRNVIELYKFLCRNYVAGETEKESDRIYLFGFSRGAFTVRVLAGLIDRCGLCTEYESERDLHAIARANYAIYREKYRGWRLSRVFPRIWDCALIRDRSRLATAVRPRIAFIGVWDTVDAYGLPVDELAKLWDRFIFPVRFEDQTLSEKVAKGCHALSIDDERLTFHPVLWDQRQECDPERIEQVWFPGVHSDVGGGYPRHDLALVSLDWMISKVEACEGDDSGLIFLSDLRAEYRRRCDWSGIGHDSRAGLGALYRYRPRNIEELCRDAGATGEDTRPPKLHRSALERIRENVVPYAPTGVAARYDVVTTRKKPKKRARRLETDEAKDARFVSMNYALDVVYWRRWLYRAFLAITLLLIATPVLVEWETRASCAGRACPIDSVCGFVEGVFPDFAVAWTASLCQNPEWLAALGALYAILSWLKRVAAARTFERAAQAWSIVKGTSTTPRDWDETATSRLRALSAGALGRAVRKAWWWMVALIALVLVLSAADRVVFHVRDSAGSLCESSNAQKTVAGQSEIAFETVEPCLPGGVELVAGTTYRFDVAAQSDWMDGELPAGPDGLVGVVPMAMKLATPFRRHPSRPWFELTGRIGRSGGEAFPIGSGTCYTARSGGEVYLYVNDAVSGLMPGRWWAFPYVWSWGRIAEPPSSRSRPSGGRRNAGACSGESAARAGLRSPARTGNRRRLRNGAIGEFGRRSFALAGVPARLAACRQSSRHSRAAAEVHGEESARPEARAKARHRGRGASSGVLEFQRGPLRAAQRSTPMNDLHGSGHGNRARPAGCAAGQCRDGRAVEC